MFLLISKYEGNFRYKLHEENFCDDIIAFLMAHRFFASIKIAIEPPHTFRREGLRPSLGNCRPS